MAARGSHEAANSTLDIMSEPRDNDGNKGVSQVERVLSGVDLQKDHMNYDRVDAELAKYANAVAIEISPEENKRLKRMIDKRVLPIMVFTYFLQALDKGTMSFAAIMGIREDIPVLYQKFAWLTTCIYIAVLIVEYPTNWIIQRVPIAKYLGFNILAWSTTLALHAVCWNFPSLVAVRTLLGIFEAVCQPTFLILSSMWYRRDEQAMIVTCWYMMNGAQQIVGGLLAYCFSLISSGPLRSWQAIFLTYGSFSFLWGLFVLYWLPDSPMRAKCFSEEDKKLMVERVRSNQTGLQNKSFRPYQIKEALLDPQSWCYCLIAICTTLPTSGLGSFSQIIISKGFKFTILQTQLLAMVLGVVIIATLISSTWLAKKYDQTLLVMGLYVIPSFIGTIVLMTVRNNSTANRVGLLISYYIVLCFWAAQTLSMSLLSRNIAGQTKKTVCVAMNFIAWAVGNAIGPQVFLPREADRYFTAFSVHMGCYVLLVLVIAFLRFNLAGRNKAKDRLAEQVVEARDEALVHAFDDLTDRENPSFRYVF